MIKVKSKSRKQLYIFCVMNRKQRSLISAEFITFADSFCTSPNKITIYYKT